MFRHRKGRLIAVAVALALSSIFVPPPGGIMGTSPLPDPVKLAPLMVSVDTSSLAPKLAQAELVAGWRLFDRDTATAYTPSQTARITVSLPELKTISRIRLFGASSYQLNVYRDNAGVWETVPSLSGLSLATLSATSWNTFTAESPFSATHLLLEFIPQGNITAGIRELEIWGDEPAGSIESASYVILDGIKTPQEALALLSKNASHIIEVSATPSEITAPDSAVSQNSGFASISLTQNPVVFKRAYIMYDGYNIYRPVSIKKRINDQTWTGGFVIAQPEGTTPDWASFIEEINPAWLVQGENKIEFRSVSGTAYIRGLKLIIEPDSGWNSVSSVSASALYDGDTSTSYEIRASSTNPSIQITFERTVQPESIRLHLPGPMNLKAGLQYQTTTGWVDVKTGWQIDLSTMQTGWNEVLIPASITTDALRLVINTSGLRIKPGIQVGTINEVRVSASPAGSVSSIPRIVISYPRDGEYFGRTAYIQGFAAPGVDSTGNTAQVDIEEKTSSNTDGAFSLSLTKDETRFYAQPDDEAWDPVVKTEYASQAGASQTVHLNKNSGPSSAPSPNKESRGDAPFADNREKYTDKVAPGQAKKIQYKGVTLDIPAGAVDKETQITIIPLTEADLARLNPGMVNVTYPDAGYRFLPHGMKFLKPIKISFGYSKTLFAAGQVDEEVNMYFYNDNLLRWQKLNRTKVDAALSLVESESDHFTDIINTTLVVPEHPQALSFNPNSIKDIKAADPSANIDLIEPPTANNKGTVNLSYPIEVPMGRSKLQPNLAVQYNSSGANGWMGLGWDISLSAITIDTRWGVPRYSGTHETETYTLDGEQLDPVAHRGDLKPRTQGTTILPGGEEVKIFHTRVEGQFRRIIRHGSAPANYWWEVIDKNGTRYIYGGNLTAKTQDSNSVLKTDGGNVFRWALRETRDTNGNTINYTYSLVTDSGVGNGTGGVAGFQLYLKEIKYTGHNATEGAYSVVFIRDREIGEARRQDVTIDARGGFKMVTADLLRKIEVMFTPLPVNGQPSSAQLVRRYQFKYNENPYGDNRPGTAFNKTLLTSIAQYGSNGTLFNTHQFSYYDEARRSNGAYNGFAVSTDWNVGNDNVGIELMGKGSASALGGNTSTGFGGHIYIGVGSAGDTSSKNLTGGLKVGYNRSTSESLLTMADMDGDGLPDKVFKGDGGFYYRKNLSGPHGIPAFGEPVHIGLPAISHEKVTTTTIGGELYFGLPIMYDHNEAETEADTYFTDVNGDGLMDLVSGGAVLFGYLNAQGVPTFSPNSADTPVPITSGTVDTNGLIADPSSREAELAAAYPLLDTIRRWVAPYDGVVRINAPVRLIQDNSQERALYTKADGVQVAIQLEGAELWSSQTVTGDPRDPASPRILADDYSTHTPTGVDNVPVQRGDRIYFRVQSVFDGAYDQVAWDPEITYLNTDTSRTDVNDRLVYRYRASQDFTLAGRRGTVTVPLTGTLHLAGRLEKTGITTDDVTLLITKNGSEVYRHTLGFADTTVLDISQDVAVSQLDILEWRILVDSPIDVTRIKFAPKAYYTSAQGVDDVTDGQGNYVIKVKPPYDIDLYPADGLTAPQASWKATKTGDLRVVPTVSFDNLVPTPAEIAFTVKKRGALLGKRFVTLSRDMDGNLIISSPTFTVPVSKDDELFFDFSARDTRLAEHLIENTVQVSYDDTVPPVYETVPSAFHSAVTEGAFPQPYRGWGPIGYNGNSPRTNKPIDQSLLVLNDSYDPNNARVYPFAPMPEQDLWGGVDEAAWVKASEASSSRLGLDDIRMLHSEDFAGAAAPSRVSESTNDAISAGFGASKGDSESKVDFQDLNGDRFPDVIGGGGVQYTRGTGQLDPTTFGGAGLGSARLSNNESFNISTDGAGNIARAIGNARGDVAPNGQKAAPTGQQGSDMPRLGFGANAGYGTSDTDHDLIDINGDGLPDKVFKNGFASLNLGYSFAPAEPWGGGIVNNGQTLNGGINMGFNTNFYSLAGGLNLGLDETRSDETYVDLNGDGLPDKVYAGSSTVLLNTGAGFTPIAWSGGHGKVALDMHVSLGGGVYFTFGWNIYVIRIVINPGVSFSGSMGRPEYEFRDVDGDGFVDHLHSERDSQLQVALNPIGRTNLLKTVKRPLGGKFEIEYTREGNTYEMPQSQWIMTRVNLSDGMGKSYRTDYAYSGPHQDRYEREFYGFDRVTETHAPGATIERSVIRTFHNDNYYFKNLLKRSITIDRQNHVWAMTENSYEPVVVADFSVFPALIRTDTYFYDGTTNYETSPMSTYGHKKQTYQTFAYDAYGNVAAFFDAGELYISSDDVIATITYWSSPHDYIIKPEEILVKNTAGGILRKRWAVYDNATGNMTRLTSLITANQNSVWVMTYDEYGNIRTITDPVGYILTYTYDDTTHTYDTRIEDNFPTSKGGPYFSEASYNFLFSQLAWSRDLNGNYQVNGYDEYGRMVSVCGPYDAASNGPVCKTPASPTIAFEYHPPVLGSSAENDLQAPAYAVTHNKAVSVNGSDGTIIKTVNFADGMKRIIQTKKDAEVDAGSGRTSIGMVVSGKVVFDDLGRVIQQGQPEFEGSSYVYDTSPVKNATRLVYDTLNRTTRVETPDSHAPGSYAVTTKIYTFGQVNNSGPLYALTIVVDPEGNKKYSHKDVDDRIVAVVEFNNGAPITTTYEYDPLGQITRVTDDKDHHTTIEYDLLGRRTAITNPDTGRTESGYDANGNLTSKLTANYQRGKEITYTYDFNRLREITYPNSTPVTYEYGAMHEAYNRAGRIKKVTDESGQEERYYGKLGEVTREEKTVEAHTPAVQKKKFSTDYVFDSFGRMVEMTYPDSEKLHYLYDNGGLLKAAWGEKKGNRYDYIKLLTYDEFDRRKRIEYGNGVTSAYTYDPLTRRLSALDTTLKDGRNIQKLTYQYDLVGNVLNLKNGIEIPTSTALPAGPVAQTFHYDDLYQLTSADGEYTFNEHPRTVDGTTTISPNKRNTYHNEFIYDTIGNFVKKEQKHTIYQPSTTTILPKETNYVLNYVYGSTKPHAVTDAGDKLYSYDPAGNMTGWTHKQNGTRRIIYWNEENRVKQIDDNGRATYFLYDDAGERVVKRGQHGETIYVNRFYSVRNGELGTKHVFAGETRVVSKLVKTPNTVTSNSGTTTTTTVVSTTTTTIPGINGLDNGRGKKLGIIRRLPDGYQVGINPPVEKDEFFYHGDHLGSSNMITDAYGAVYQHLEYFPYGETWIEEGGSYGGNTPGYKFTGKELDPETGLYYYGARYYDPVLSRWLSADPILEKYLPIVKEDKEYRKTLPGMGGIYNPINLGLYQYAGANPIKYIDPDGKVIDTIADVGFVGWDIYDLFAEDEETGLKGYEISGNWAVLGIDAGSTLIPFVTGGGRALKVARFLEHVALGRKFEERVLATYKFAKNTLKFATKYGNVIPDIFDKTRKVIGEIKHYKKLGLGKQLKGIFEVFEKEAARDPNMTFKLFVTEETKFTKPLLEKINELREKGFKIEIIKEAVEAAK